VFYKWLRTDRLSISLWRYAALALSSPATPNTSYDLHLVPFRIMHVYDSVDPHSYRYAILSLSLPFGMSRVIVLLLAMVYASDVGRFIVKTSENMNIPSVKFEFESLREILPIERLGIASTSTRPHPT